MNHLKKISLLAILAIAVLTPVAVTQAFAATLTPAVPDNGPVGQTVTLEAANGQYTATNTINATILGHIHDISASPIVVNATGGFKGTATIPADATVGSNTITTDDGNGNVGSTSFTVTTSAIDAAVPTQGPVRQNVAINFNHFISGQTVAVTIGGTAVTESPITTNSSGGFAGTVHLGIGTPAGVTTVSATDGTNTVTTPFTVTTSAVDAASPNSGPVGQAVAINFNNFIANGTSVSVKIAGTAVTESPVTVNATGGFAGTVHVGAGTAAGLSTLVVSDGANSASTAFTVTTPNINAASPAQGPVRQNVLISFNNFITGHTVAVTVGGTAVTESPITTNATGGFTGTVHLGIGTPAGVTTVSATDATTTVTTPFTVTTSAVDAASPNSGPVGQAVAINFNNFIANGTSVSVKIAGTAVTESPVTVNATGGFAGTVHVGAGTAAGLSTLVVSDGANSASTAFTVTTPNINAASPAQGPVRQNVLISFNNFITGHTVAVTVGGTAVTESPITTNATGGFTGTVHLGIGTPAGVTTVSATDATTTVTTPFTVTTSAVDAASPNSGPVGQAVAINFNNFIANGTSVSVKIAGTAVTESPVTVNATGGFAGTVHVGAGTAAGLSTLVVSDGANSASTAFTVTTPNINAASPAQGPVRQNVAINFNNLKSGPGATATVTITVTEGTAVTESPITLNATGGFAGTVHVGVGTGAGLGTLAVSDGTNTPTTPFTVTTPAVDAASPNFGPVNQAVAINFNHFIANGTSVSVKIHGTAVTESPVTVNATGGFAGTVHVGAGTAAGLDNLVVSDGANSASTAFTVTAPAINTASPNNGPVRQNVLISFNNFITGQTVAVTVGGTAVTESPITTNSTGGFTGTVHLGVGTPAGVTTVSATDGTTTVTTPFTVTTSAVDAASPNFGPVNQAVAINFNHFIANGTSVSVKIHGTAVTESPVTVNATGGFAGTVHVGAGTAAGLDNLVVSDGANSASTAFTVTAPTINTASPNNGPVRQNVLISFNNFITGQTVAVTVGGTAVTESPITTNSTGGFTGTVHLGVGTPAGVTTVSATDGTTTVTTPFTVFTSTVNAAVPNNGPVGTAVAINFNHFIANGTSVSVKIHGTAVTESPVTVNATGGFAGTVHVGAGTAAGLDNLVVSDGANSASTAFTVTAPTINTASPNNGPTRQNVVISFNNFITGHTVAVTIGGTAVTESPITTNATGGFTGTVHLGVGTPAGVTTVSATDGTTTVTTPFTVTTSAVDAASPNFGPVNQAVAINFNHFIANGTSVSVKIHGTAVTESPVTVNATGGFAGTVHVGAGTAAGLDNLVVSDGANSASTAFTVTTPNINAASPAQGPVRQNVLISFNNFITGHTVAVTIGGTAVTESPITTNATGGFTGTVHLGVGTPAGVTTVSATDGTNTQTTPFTVTTSAVDAASPNSGPVGTAVAINFNHFIANGTSVSVKIHGTAVTESPVTVNATGGFAGTVHVGAGTAAGLDNLVVSDGANSASTAFTVTAPTINTAVPTSGPVGQPVLINFNNLIANTAYTVKFGSTLAFSGTTNATGGFTGTVTVPTGATNTITISDGTNSPTTAFTVTTRTTSTASPNNGPIGQAVAFSVNHFIAGPGATAAVTIGGTAVTESPITLNATGGFAGTVHVAAATPSGVSTVSVTDGNGTTTTPFTVTTSVINSASPTEGPKGQGVALAFNHFISGATSAVTVGGTAVTESPITVNATGGFAGTVHVGATTPSGVTILSVFDGTNNQTTPFTVTTPVINSVSPNHGPVGQGVVIAFNHFRTDSTVTVKIGAQTAGTPSVNSTGGFNGTFNVPASADSSGVSIDDTSNTVTSPFTVTTRSLSAAVPAFGPIHQGGNITGNSFIANHALTFTINVGEGTSLPTEPSVVTTNSTGGFTARFAVPTDVAGPGLGTIGVFDGAATVTTPFTVTTSAINTVSPNNGPIGQPVLITANHFATNGTFTVYIGGQPVGTPAMNSTGGFSGTFNVPASADENQVLVSDGANNVTSTFTITTPTFSTPATPDNGPTRTPVSFSVNHFISGSTITLKLNSTTLVTTPATLTANSTGGVDGTFKVPSGFAAGAATVNATEGTNFATTPFTVTTSTTSYNPAGGATGTTITATGLHFVPSFPITIKYDTTTVKTLTANTTGGYVTTFVVPPSSIGSHNVIASDNATHSVTTPISVTTAMTISPASGPNGTQITVTGSNLIPTSSITITYNGTTVTTTPASVLTDSSGAFTAKFNVPGSPTGAATIQVTDGVNSPNAFFTVTTPAIMLDPSSGVAGQSFKITGTNVVPSHAITFKFNGATITSTPTTVTSNATGGFTATLKVPASPSTNNNVTASDGTNTPTATFTVGTTSAISLSPASAGVGKIVTVTGSDFIPSHVITFKLGTTVLVTTPTTVTSNSTGGFSGVTFKVPTGTTFGIKTITASDGTTSPTAGLTVVAGITLSPLTGPNGTSITVTGANYLPNHSITIQVDEGTLIIPTVPASITSSPTGGFTATLKIVNETNPTANIFATDTTRSDNLDFIMQTPNVSITPATGVAGQTVTISGNHLVASHAITFKVGATTVTTTPATVTSNSTGGFKAVTFKVPGTAVSGANTVTANDGTNSPSDTFTIGSSPVLILSPSSGNVGQTISVSGLHLAPTTKVTLKFGTAVLVTTPATVNTNTTGGFTATFKVPAALASTVTVTGSDGTNSPTDSFTVNPFITLVSSSGPNGTQVTVTGTSFGATQPILLLYNGAPITTTPGSITSTSAGAFTGKFTVTNFPTGANTISAIDTSNSANANFNAVAPSISLSPTSGAKGQTVKVTGLNFVPTHAVTFKLNATTLTPVAAVTSNATGGFVASFIVPSSAAALNIISATDGTNTPTANFAITTSPSISLDTGSAGVGQTVKITGINLVPSHAVTFKFNGTALVTTPATVSTNSTGGLSTAVSFKVPTSKTGLATILASDGTNSPTTTLTIVTGLTLSPTSGSNGTQVTFTGTNFAPTTVFTFTFNGTGVTTTPATITSTSAGALTGKFTVSSPSGPQSLVASDGASTTATFTVNTSTITLNPSSGVKGQTVKVTGLNFVPTHAVTFKLNATTLTPVAAVTSNATGGFVASFIVPSSAAALNIITASDGTNTPTANFAISTAPTISLDTGSAGVGQTVKITGINLVPSHAVTFKFNGTALVTTPATVSTNSTGGLSTAVSFKVPASKTGVATILASDGSNSPTTTLTVISGLTLSPTSGPNGTQVTFTGTSFAPTTVFTFTFNGTLVTTTPATITSTSAGALTGKFTVSSPSGPQSLVASDGASTTATFTVNTSTITLNPSSGVKGQTVKVTGLNFVPSHAVTFKLNATTLTPVAAVTSNATGGFVASFIVPSSAAALNIITASDGTNTPTAQFTISTSPSISLNAGSGIVGQTVKITGINLAPSHAVTFKFNGTALVTTPATVTTNSTGGLSTAVSFKVPPSKTGLATILASDGTNSPTTTFTVNAFITLSPTSGPNGTQVTFTGTSFRPSTTFAFTLNETGVTTTPATITSTSAGALTGKFTVSSPSGPVFFAANDAANTNATFTVKTSTITLNPSSGVKGQTITVTGLNFVPTHAVTFKLNATTLTPVAAVTSNSTGGFVGKFVVPSSAAALNIITASDGTNTPTAQFTIGTTPTASLLSSTGFAGSSVSVSGSHLSPLTKVTIKFDTTSLVTTPTTVTTDSSGSFTAVARIPVGITGGSHTIITSDGTNSPTTSFNVVSRITLSPTSGSNGTQVTFTGTSFAPTTVFTFTFNGTPVTTTPATITSTAAGALTGKFTVSSPSGPQHLVASDAASTNATFTVKTSTITLSPTNGVKGQTITVTGLNFVPTHAVTFKLNATTLTPVAAVTSNSTGGFVGKFVVPSSAAALNIITASDGTNTPTAQFTIGTTPTISLGTGSGIVGNTVSITGINLTPSKTVTFKFNGTALVTIPATVTTNSTGGLSTAVSFKVPTSKTGLATILASDGSNSPTTTFTVNAFITLSPTSGPNGTQVTFTGTSFRPTTVFTFTFNGTGVTTTPATITSTSAGALTGKFTVSSPSGPQSLVASDGASTTATFTVKTSTITLSPTNGVKGQTITVTGLNFVPTHAVTFKLNATTLTPVAAVTSNSTGGFVGKFVVPSSAAALNIISATDGTNTPTAQFTIGTTPTISLDTGSGIVGQTVKITGINLVPSHAVTFKFNGTALVTTPATVTTNSTGGLSTAVSFKVPTSKTGLATILASDGTNSPTTTLTIVTGLTLSPTSGSNGTQVTFTGTNFAPTTVFTFTFNGTGVTTTPATITSTSAGALTGKFTVSSPSGPQSLVASDGASTTATFTVNTSTITLNPSSGVKGQTVKVTGLNFVPTHAVTFKLNATTLTPIAAVTSNSTGGFVASFIVPSSAAALNIITASDGTNTPTAQFTIGASPTISLGTGSGIVGNTVSITGLNLVPSHAVTFKINGTALVTIPATVTTNSTGGLSTAVSFKVPASKTGLATILASDGTNNPTTTFTINAFITLAPTSGPNGTQVTFTGTSFRPTTVFTFTFNGTGVTTTPATITSTAAGALTGKFTVSSPSGPQSLVASDGASTTASFTVKTSAITLSPTNGVKGQTVKVTGLNFVPTKPITFKLNATTLTPVAAVTSNATGGFVASFIVPSSAAALNIITASDGTNTPTAQFTIGASPTISLGTGSGIVGNTVSITGLNLVPSHAVTFKINGTALVTIPATVTTNSTGGLSTAVSFKVPASKAGLATILASDGSNSPTTTFTINAFITIVPTSGPNGTSVSVTGTSFLGTHTITLTFNGSPVTTTPATITSTAAGGFTAKFSVPGSSSEDQTVQASDGINTPTATFTVTTPSVTLSTGIAKPNGFVTLTGTNFVSSHAITIKFDGTTPVLNPSTITSTSSGAFTATLVVPSSATESVHKVTVSDGNSTLSKDLAVTRTSIAILEESNSRITIFPVINSTTTGANATVAIGQPDLVSKNTGLTQNLMDYPSGGLVFDSAGNMWVADSDQNRILKFNKPFTTGESASFVIGGTDFTSTYGGTDARTFNFEHSLAFDSSGNLWVADQSNNRVLEFAASSLTGSNGPSAIHVIGQKDFTSTVVGRNSTNLKNPDSLVFDSSGNLWVGDGAGGSGNGTQGRVLKFPAAALGTDHPAATFVLGEPSFTSSISGITNSTIIGKAGVNMAFDSSGNLWVPDPSNNRVLKYPASNLIGPNGPAATFVIGQVDFTHHSSGTTNSTMNRPNAVSFDSLGNIWVTDNHNHRVLEFPAASLSGPNGPAATHVIGQKDFVSGDHGTAADKLYYPGTTRLLAN